MKNNKKVIWCFIITAVFIFTASPVFSNDSLKSDNCFKLKEFGVFSGWGEGKLIAQDHLQVIPLFLQFGFDMKPILSKIKIKLKGDVNFVLEPLLNTVISPNNNVELGCNFMVKYSFPLINKLHLYLEAGPGLLYGTQHINKQSTQFNFSEQAGAGLKFYFSANKAINFGYRFRHFSNAGIKEPNHGVNTDLFLCGLTISY